MPVLVDFDDEGDSDSDFESDLDLDFLPWQGEVVL
jgi:hypothetical protein